MVVNLTGHFLFFFFRLKNISPDNSTTSPNFPSLNWILVAGTGKTCLRVQLESNSNGGGGGQCGDGARATQASLEYPKV